MRLWSPGFRSLRLHERRRKLAMTWSSRFQASSLLLLILAGVAVAGEDLACTCAPDSGCISDYRLGREWVGWRREQVLERLQPARLAGHWAEAVDTLIDFFISHSDSVDAATWASTLKELRAFRREAWALESGHPEA